MICNRIFILITLLLCMAVHAQEPLTEAEKPFAEFFKKYLFSKKPFSIRFQAVDYNRHITQCGILEYKNIENFNLLLENKMKIHRRGKKIAFSLTGGASFYMEYDTLFHIPELAFLKPAESVKSFAAAISSLAGMYAVQMKMERGNIHSQITADSGAVMHIWFQLPENIPVKVTEYSPTGMLTGKLILNLSYIPWDERKQSVSYSSYSHISSDQISLIADILLHLFNTP